VTDFIESRPAEHYRSGVAYDAVDSAHSGLLAYLSAQGLQDTPRGRDARGHLRHLEDHLTVTEPDGDLLDLSQS